MKIELDSVKLTSLVLSQQTYIRQLEKKIHKFEELLGTILHVFYKTSSEDIHGILIKNTDLSKLLINNFGNNNGNGNSNGNSNGNGNDIENLYGDIFCNRGDYTINDIKFIIESEPYRVVTEL